MKGKIELIASFDQYVTAINEYYAEVREALDNEEWERAQLLMTAISQSQAQTSIRIKSSIVRMVGPLE